MRKMRTWRECLIEQIADRKSAIAYLKAILEDYQIYKNPAVVQRSLRTVVEAQGGVVELAKQVNMDPQVLSKMLSNEDGPLIDVLGIVLKTLGYQLSIQPIKLENRNLDTYTDALEGQNTSTHVAGN
jgi:DNA-binding phage protein